ncbi:MAG: pilus assembly protein [Thermoflexus sp.]|uniref:TadE family protein n=1 Tax=Thermoflexus sp. TaxID=1969742 RepID=UPI0025D75BDB|nr:TadE family protein [Thermoflexus sp.]MDW8065859.1 pilus assembly protein [Anaerolineae bacterium]MCS6964066.1 pilus assembly protein [Thermoflexus sp.]MCS7351831.1 pilus assembly protein [Thermoflexus sp.]MDW8181290.1 pilus assembly protein [Anaerolineae bacterium]MDW8183865.1 pilus assembly protein [Anaerolineae bacterium]
MRRRIGQSLVELAILLPVLLIMVGGLAELGFALAAYMSLQDAAREAARFGADGDPCGGQDPELPDVTCTDVSGFYEPVARRFDQAFAPYRLVNTAGDDIIISVFGVRESGALAWRLPKDHPSGWSRFGNQVSRVSNAYIAAVMGHSPSKGILVVEVHYRHFHRLGLFRSILPDPIPMYAIAWMPLPSADPLR